MVKQGNHNGRNLEDFLREGDELVSFRHMKNSRNGWDQVIVLDDYEVMVSSYEGDFVGGALYGSGRRIRYYSNGRKRKEYKGIFDRGTFIIGEIINYYRRGRVKSGKIVR